jgi:hypothetical protein
VPGRGGKVPAPIRRVRRGYSYLGLGAVFGGWVLIMVGGYFFNLSYAFDLRYLYAALALWVCAAILFGLAIRLSMFLRRAHDASSATVTAFRRGGRTLMLDAPRDGYPSGLRVRRVWWATPEALLPGETVTLYGRPGSTGRVLVSSPARGRAFVGRGRRRPATPAGYAGQQDAPPEPPGRRTWGRYLRWGPPVLAGLGLAVAVAATVIASVPQLTGHVTEGQLRAGDCLTGSNLGLGTSSPWPFMVATVPCTNQHLAEVFFSGNAWPQSMSYPGDNAVYHQADSRCLTAFRIYDGLDNWESAFTYQAITPTPRWDWASGDRQLVCVAYQPGWPVDYPIKGSFQ